MNTPTPGASAKAAIFYAELAVMLLEGVPYADCSALPFTWPFPPENWQPSPDPPHCLWRAMVLLCDERAQLEGSK